MSADFAAMLRETLENMQAKITQANEKWESENDGQLLKRFEEYAGTNKDKWWIYIFVYIKFNHF